MSERNDIDAGQPAPDFTLPTAGSMQITLSSFRGQQNVVIFFMREFV